MANSTAQNGQHEAHEHSSRGYWLVYALLLVFTGLTYFTGRMHVSFALPLALAIATTKATLVALFFMHLYEQGGANRLVLVTSFFFVTLLIFFSVADVATRFKPATPAGAPFGYSGQFEPFSPPAPREAEGPKTHAPGQSAPHELPHPQPE